MRGWHCWLAQQCLRVTEKSGTVFVQLGTKFAGDFEIVARYWKIIAVRNSLLVQLGGNMSTYSTLCFKDG
jgi:hypothetical protein